MGQTDNGSNNAGARLPETREEQLAAFDKIAQAIIRHAGYRLRGHPDPEFLADVIQEALTLAWSDFLACLKRGVDLSRREMSVAGFRVRRALGTVKASYCTVSRPVRTRSRVHQDPPASSVVVQHFDGAPDAQPFPLMDARGWSPADAAAFRLDWSAFLAGRSERELDAIDALVAGESGKAAARSAGVNHTTVWRWRARWRSEWATATA